MNVLKWNVTALKSFALNQITQKNSEVFAKIRTNYWAKIAAIFFTI